MARIRSRDTVFALAVTALAGLAGAAPGLDGLRGLSIDVLTALRWRTFGDRHAPAASPAVVIALDEETHRTPPFAGTPQVTWTREIGRVLTAVAAADARVIGFDVIFPTSIEQSEIPIGEDTLGARVRGFDRDYLRALALVARADKLVLGQVQHGDQPIVPSPGQRLAVGGQRNLRALNYHNDPDDIVRRIPVTLTVDGVVQPSFAVELAGRALGARPHVQADVSTILGGYAIPSRIANTMAVNFEGGADDIPTYSLADLRACLQKGDAEFFRRAFAGKVVLVGAVLDVEDRKITSKRFATAPEGARTVRCALPASPPGPFARDSIAGVYIHAAAVNNLLRGEALRETGPLGAGAITAAAAALAVTIGFALAPVAALAAYAAAAVAFTGGATAAFQHALALPLVEPLLLGLLALAVTVGYRFIVTDKDKRLLRRSFALYLAPAVIEKMLSANTLPALGGETREVTVFFSDVAGFSSFSEMLTPPQLVALMNEYLTAMTDIIEAHGGFVDKYIGDAIVAVFGAPLEDPDHARHAVEAALACRSRLEDLNRTAASFAGHRLDQRIGLNSGEVLVGNIGSRRRFNYTVMGDTVNLASRLEGANKFFASRIMAADATVERAGPGILWRELDAIRVKGRRQPVRIYEPLARADEATPDLAARAAIYAEGLACWRKQEFKAAAQAFDRIAEEDAPSALFAKRAQALSAHPPGPDWEPVNTLEGK